MPVAILCACAYAMPVGGMSVAAAQDDMQAAGAVWSDFVDSLRRGEYRNAHSLFSPGSRAAMPYPEFVAEYGPLSVAREMALAKPESLATTLDGDWAEITYGGTSPGTNQKFRVGVALAKNRGGWGLVAARNETAERAEAGARGLLSQVWNARAQGTPGELVNALNAAHAKNPVLQFYRIETNGQAVRAFPLKPNLRTFYLDGTGVARAMGESGLPPASNLNAPQAGQSAQSAMLNIPQQSVLPPLPGEALPGSAKPAIPALLENGMPELSEPPPRRSSAASANRAAGKSAGMNADLNGEIAEPSLRLRDDRPGMRKRPELSLPDTIR